VLADLVSERLVICPKVALQDMFFVSRPNENVHYFNKLYRKNLDFLLLQRDSLKPALAIELDYPQQTNHRPKDDFLDGLCASAGLPLVHVTVSDTYNVAELAACFREAMKNPREPHTTPRQADFSPICPKCGITMVLRIHRTGPEAGRQYYGCLNYPQCMETVGVEQRGLG
jgi:hypothetical protein